MSNEALKTMVPILVGTIATITVCSILVFLDQPVSAAEASIMTVVWIIFCSQREKG